MTTTVTAENQVSLPLELARELGLHPGVEVEWSRTADGALLARRKPTRAELVHRLTGRGQRFFTARDHPVQDLIEEREREDAEEESRWLS